MSGILGVGGVPGIVPTTSPQQNNQAEQTETQAPSQTVQQPDEGQASSNADGQAPNSGSERYSPSTAEANPQRKETSNQSAVTLETELSVGPPPAFIVTVLQEADSESNLRAAAETARENAIAAQNLNRLLDAVNDTSRPTSEAPAQQGSATPSNPYAVDPGNVGAAAIAQGGAEQPRLNATL